MQIKSKSEEVLGKVEVQIIIKEEITELRKTGDRSSNEVRPILVELKSWNKRKETFQAAKKLKGRKIYKKSVKN